MPARRRERTVLLGLGLLLLCPSASHAAPPTSKLPEDHPLAEHQSPPPVNRPPTVRFTTPTGDVTLPTPAPLELQVEAHDPDGDQTILRVDFFANGDRLGSDETAPYTFTWTPTPMATTGTAPPLRKGDANLDGQRSTLDITFMRRHILGLAPLSEQGFKNAAAMASSYEELTTLDIVVLRRCILGIFCAATTDELTATVTDADNLTGTTPQGVTVTVQADTAPPTGTISINNGAPYTKSPTVTLTLSATDNSGVVSQMRFSNDNVTYTPPETYTATKRWTLAEGDGRKTVYVQCSDRSGNWSGILSDTITLQAIAPEFTIRSPTDGQVFSTE